MPFSFCIFLHAPARPSRLLACRHRTSQPTLSRPRAASIIFHPRRRPPGTPAIAGGLANCALPLERAAGAWCPQRAPCRHKPPHPSARRAPDRDRLQQLAFGMGRSGEPRPGADSQPGLALQQATRRKCRDTHPELACSPRCHLVVFFFGCSLSRWRASGAPRPQPSAGSSRGRELSVRTPRSRWSSIIAVAAERALAGSLLELPLDTVGSAAGGPAVPGVLQNERWLHAPAPSRLLQRT